MKIGLQLYTIRDSYETGEEFIEALKKVKEIGFEGVEFAGYAGLSAEELRNALKDIGLVPIASHHNVTQLDEELTQLIQYNHLLGSKFVVCSYSPAVSADDLAHLEKVLKDAQIEANKYGIQVLYHNHTHELLPMEAGVPLDLIKGYCGLEVDTYWVFNSKTNVRSYLKTNAEKIGLVHLKDGDLEGHPCAIGEGSNDIQTILGTSCEIGAEWVIIENDDPIPDGLSDITRSMQNLRSKYKF